MRTKTFFNYVVAALFCCCVTGMVTSCQSLMDTGSADNPSAENMLRQGVWTEHDTALGTAEYTEEQADALSNPEKYTDEELEAILSSIESIEEPPAVGMMVEGDKAYFFTYSAEGADNLVEGKISYDKDAKKGTIAFPAITGSPISGQTVNFTMVSEETMEFEFTYEGKKVTGSCAWLCDNLDNWGTDDEGDWKELEPYYKSIAETAGPDGSIDWSDSEAVTIEDVDDEGNIVEKEVTLTDLDKPLEWKEEVASARAGTRMVDAVLEGVSAGIETFTSIFEPDPVEEINAKLDAVLEKLDNALVNQQKMLENQQKMMAQLNEANARLIAIAETMKQQATIDIFNNRTQTYYNPLKLQNTAYFNSAFKLYNDNKSDLSKVKDKLGEYGKEWVGKNEEYMTLTWNYIEYLETVRHSTYGTGVAAIYDGLTFEKYPWEHMGIGDRQTYRANDMILIAKCLFMINLYAAYGGGSDIKKEGIYNNYNEQKPKLKKFCEFKVSDPDKFRVCQIPGAHFIMHKELQTYHYCGKDNKAPDPNHQGKTVCYRPEWHKAGSIKIENPEELRSKLISPNEFVTLCQYYTAAFATINKKSEKPQIIYAYAADILGNGHEMAAGAVFAEGLPKRNIAIMAYDKDRNTGNNNGIYFSPSRRELFLEMAPCLEYQYNYKNYLKNPNYPFTNKGYPVMWLGYPVYQNGNLIFLQNHKNNYYDNNYFAAIIIAKRY